MTLRAKVRGRRGPTYRRGLPLGHRQFEFGLRCATSSHSLIRCQTAGIDPTSSFQDQFTKLGCRLQSAQPVVERTRAAPAMRTSACFRRVGAMCDCETTWTGFRAWQARQRRLGLPIERCDGNLSSTRMFVGHMLEHSLVGDRIWEAPRP